MNMPMPMYEHAMPMVDRHIHTSAAELRQLKVADVGLFPVVNVPMNMYKYTLPLKCLNNHSVSWSAYGGRAV